MILALALLICGLPDKAVLVGAAASASWSAGVAVGTVSKGASAPVKACTAEVRSYRGKPAVWINGKPEFAYTFLMHTGDFAKEYRQAAEAGIRFFTLGAGLGNTPEGFNPAGCDAPFITVLNEQPQALMFPRIDVTAPGWWLTQHPDDAVVFDDGSKGPQSMFSEAWLADACRWIEEYSRYIRRSPYADHIIGIHICSGYTGEWQSWGLWDDRRGDFSPVALEAWKRYLTEKYRSDAALAEAWGQPVTFETAAIPTRQRRQTPGEFFRMPPRDQDILDFYDYYWRGTVRAVTQLAAAAKRGGGRDFLTGFFYGYEIQYGGMMQESQHLGMKQVMDCPDIDFFCSPAMYSVRQPGGTSTFMSFTESIQQRGKFWWDEADNRTHLSRSDLARAADQWESLQVLKREYAHALTRQTGLWWFDMEGGWYDDPAILKLFKQQREFGESNPGAWQPRHEVAVFVDDKSSYRLAPESAFLGENITQLLSRMPQLGAPYDTYLLSDLAGASDYRLYIFPDAFDLSKAERKAIEALKRAGKTLLFIGPAGVGRYKDGRVEHDPEFSKALIGVAPEDDAARHETLDGWRLDWFPKQYPPIAELKTIAREAGVHLYCASEDAVYAGNGVIALHAQQEGAKSLVFPGPVHLQELFTDTPFEWTGTQLDLTLKAKETRCYAVR